MFIKTVSNIPCQADWLFSFLLQLAVEIVSASGLQPETILSRLFKQLGGRISCCVDIYEKIDMRTQTFDVPPQEVNIIRKDFFSSLEGTFFSL